MADASDLIPLKEVIQLLPKRDGKPIHRSTIERWIQSGKLETVKVGGIRYASKPMVLAMMNIETQVRNTNNSMPNKKKESRPSVHTQTKVALTYLDYLRRFNR